MVSCRPCDGGPGSRNLRRPALLPAGATTEGSTMPHVETKDGTSLFYNDWGSGMPVVLIHG